MSDLAKTETLKPGIYPTMSRSEYYKLDAANYSLLKNFDRTPAHARDAMLHPSEPTPAMELGTALHLAILEPERFAKEYVQAPKFDRRTTAGKAAWADFEASHPGRGYLKADEWEQCMGMQAAIRAHPEAKMLTEGPGKNEVAVVWRDEETGLLCKALLDRFTSFYGQTAVVDVKSTQDASPKGFPRQIANFFYHVQAAFYTDGLKAIAPMDRFWIWIACESERPYAAACYQPDEAMIAEGRAVYKKALKKYAECLKTGIWPAYPGGIEVLELPKWAYQGG